MILIVRTKSVSLKINKIVVIGGAGFIGRHISSLLLESRSEVVVVGRKESAPKELPEGCRYINGDYGDANTLREILSPDCGVVGLAGSGVCLLSDFQRRSWKLDSDLNGKQLVAQCERYARLCADKKSLKNHGHSNLARRTIL